MEAFPNSSLPLPYSGTDVVAYFSFSPPAHSTETWESLSFDKDFVYVVALFYYSGIGIFNLISKDETS